MSTCTTIALASKMGATLVVTPMVLVVRLKTLPKKSVDPQLCLEMVFGTADGDRVVSFYKRGLGAEFWQRYGHGATEIQKVRPGGCASALGLQVGWSVKSVGGLDVTGKTFPRTMKAITSALKALPM